MKKSIFLTAIAAVLALASCGDGDDYSYAIGESSKGAYIVTDKSSFVFLPGQEQALNVKVARTVATDAETVTLSGDNAKFQVPASVAFAAGEKDKSISIPFTMATGESEKLTITITSTTSQYAPASVTLKVSCDYNWKSLGTGSFTDGFFMGDTYDVEIMYTPDVAGLYRVMKPYDAAIKAEGAPGGLSLNGKQCDYIQLRLLQVGEVLEGVTLTLPDLVYFDEAETGYTYDELASSISILHPSGSASLRTEADYSYNKVLDYQEDGKTPGLVQLAPRYLMTPDGRGWNYNQNNEMVVITFPGYSPKDYELGFKYSGNFADQFGKGEYALGSVTLGADVASARLAVATDANYDDVVAALAAGTTGEVVEASGEVKVPVAGGSDHYYMVIVAFDEDGNAVAAEDFRFFFTSCKEQWTVVGTGVYTYGAESLNVYDVDGMSFYEGTANATLYKSTTTDGLYTIKPWANAEANYGLTFWWDTASNEVIVDGADTGDEDIWEEEGETYNEGAVTFYELALVGVEAGYASFYDPASKTFNFYCTYLNAEGNWYGAVKETFVLDAAATSRSFSLTPFAKAKHHGKAHRINFMMKRALSAKKNIKITM